MGHFIPSDGTKPAFVEGTSVRQGPFAPLLLVRQGHQPLQIENINPIANPNGEGDCPPNSAQMKAKTRQIAS